jgi:hypothetical protein
MAELEHKTHPRCKSRGTKYYRVILSGIDPRKETPDTFALKLSIQTRTPISRINSIVRNLPAPIKSGLDVTQARKFSAVMEELGGKTTIESYYLRPGESHISRSGQHERGHLHAEWVDDETAPAADKANSLIKLCISCGWENSEDASHCEFCHRKFEPEKPTNPADLK